MADRIPWQIQGEYVEACNCDFGCPCNFSGFPTRGNCEANIAFRIQKGKHGNTSLDGLNAAAAVKWPGPIHEGKGTVAVFIDERASQAQRDALVRILTGQDGGQPWEIIAGTLANIKGPFFAPITFESKGTKSRVSTTGVDVQLQPFKNPVSGEETEAHTLLPKGFIWRDGQVCMTGRNVSKVEGVEFDWTGKNAYFAPIDWSNRS